MQKQIQSKPNFIWSLPAFQVGQKMLMLLSTGGCENFAFWLYLPALICVNLWPMEETSIKRASKKLMILPMAGPPFVRAAGCFVRVNNMFESCLFRQNVSIGGD